MSAGLVLTMMAGAALQERALRQARQARADAEGLIQFMNEDLTEQLRPLGRLRLLDNVNRTVRQYYSGQPMKPTPSDPSAGKAQFYRNNASVLREMGRLEEAKRARVAIALLEPSSPGNPLNLSGLWRWRMPMRKCHYSCDQDPLAPFTMPRISCGTATARRTEPGESYALAALAIARLELGSCCGTGKNGGRPKSLECNRSPGSAPASANKG